MNVLLPGSISASTLKSAHATLNVSAYASASAPGPGPGYQLHMFLLLFLAHIINPVAGTCLNDDTCGCADEYVLSGQECVAGESNIHACKNIINEH